MSGGGAKGVAHIGVIKALEEENIPIDYATGTSMGAIVAALYAMGYTPDEMIASMKSEEFQHWYTGTLDRKYMFYFKQNKEVPDMLTKHFLKNITAWLWNLISEPLKIPSFEF